MNAVPSRRLALCNLQRPQCGAQCSAHRSDVFRLHERVVHARNGDDTNARLRHHLIPSPQRLLRTILGGAEQMQTHRQLLRDVWGPGASEPHYVRVYMAQLRHKLEKDPAEPRWLLTETGVGYRLQAEPS